MSTERQRTRTQGPKLRKSDPAIYLRTYDVIRALDRTGNAPWWERAFASISRLRQSAPRAAKADAIEAVAEEPALSVAPTPAQISAAIPAKKPEPPLVVTLTPLTSEHVAASIDVESPRTLPEQVVRAAETRQVSWVLLTIVAMITAGLTFAAIHFAWASLSARDASPQPKHVSTYVSSRSAVLPDSFLN